jgi:tetratricopeptide (TPR) repeat protein
MSPWARLVATLVLVWLFVWALVPGEAPTSGEEPDVEQWILASRDEFAGGRWAAALGPTRALVERFPSQQVYSDRLARIYFHLGKPVEEAAAWEQFVKSSSTPQDACPALAQAYERAGDRDASLQAFERCRDFDPMSAEGWFFLGQAYRRVRRHADALQTFREAVRIDPLHPDSRVGLAAALLGASEPREALETIGPAIERDGGNADVHLMQGLALQRLGRRAEARAALDRAAAITETYADVQIALGILDFAEGRPREARDRFERALTLDPQRQGELQIWLDRTAEAGR